MTTIHDDLIERSVDIHWPDGFDPVHADLFAHNAIVINAPVEKIWATLTAADAWPGWYSNATEVVVNDPSGQLSAMLPSTGKHSASRSPARSPSSSRTPTSVGTAPAINCGPFTPGSSSPDPATARTLSWKKSAWATEHDTSPSPIPATCIAATICGTSASSSRVKRDTALLDAVVRPRRCRSAH